jgi:hypothetical protein
MIAKRRTRMRRIGFAVICAALAICPPLAHAEDAVPIHPSVQGPLLCMSASF